MGHLATAVLGLTAAKSQFTYFTVSIFKKDQTTRPPWGRLPIPHLSTGHLLFHMIPLWLVPEAGEIQVSGAGGGTSQPGHEDYTRNRDQGVQKLP